MFARHFKVFLNLSGADKHYLLPPFDTLPTTRFATAEMKLRFAYKEKFLSQPNGIRSLGTVYPIVWLSYTHAFPNLFGSQYEYDRFKDGTCRSDYPDRDNHTIDAVRYALESDIARDAGSRSTILA